MNSNNVKAVKDFVTRVAEKKGWRINPDSEQLSGVLGGLSTNLSRFGYYLCPCRDGSGNKKLDADIICPCDYAQADLDDHGHCYCGLFFTPVLADSGRRAEPIPERRPSEPRTTEAETDGADEADDLCSIRDIVREINKLEQRLRSVHGLTLNEALCLCCISKMLETPGECAVQMGLSPSRISRILNSLEKKELIERRPVADNRRSTALSLTEAGKSRLQRLRLSGFSFSKLDGRSTEKSDG